VSADDDFEAALGLSLFQKLRLWVALPVMKDILTRFWTDPAYFTGIIRAGIGVLASAVLGGKITFANPTLESWVWNLAMLWPIILAKPAGQMNRSPGETKALARDPEIPITPKDAAAVEVIKAGLATDAANSTPVPK
jgi:hypothetical protein